MRPAATRSSRTAVRSARDAGCGLATFVVRPQANLRSVAIDDGDGMVRLDPLRLLRHAGRFIDGHGNDRLQSQSKAAPGFQLAGRALCLRILGRRVPDQRLQL